MQFSNTMKPLRMMSGLAAAIFYVIDLLPVLWGSSGDFVIELGHLENIGAAVEIVPLAQADHNFS